MSEDGLEIELSCRQELPERQALPTQSVAQLLMLLFSSPDCANTQYGVDYRRNRPNRFDRCANPTHPRSLPYGKEVHVRYDAPGDKNRNIPFKATLERTFCVAAHNIGVFERPFCRPLTPRRQRHFVPSQILSFFAVAPGKLWNEQEAPGIRRPRQNRL